MVQIIWSNDAINWLHSISSYIAQDSPQAANKVVSEILKKVEVLHDFPEIGQIYREEPDGVIRTILFGHYRIAYLIDKKHVTILGVFHGAMDMSRYL